MRITQTDLDTLGVAPNPLYNTDLKTAQTIVDWATKCGVPIGTLSINFTNPVGGPWPMPMIPVAEVSGAIIDPNKKYAFVAARKDGSTTLLGYVNVLLNFYGPQDVLKRIAAEVGTYFPTMPGEYLQKVVNDAIAAAAPKVE